MLLEDVVDVMMSLLVVWVEMRRPCFPEQDAGTAAA